MTSTPTRKSGTARLSREAWLAAAVEVLADNGLEKLRIDELAAELGVTKGSFYWHFADREEFLQSLFDYWADRYTEEVVRKLVELEGDASARLLALMEMLADGDYARYDMAFRAWSVREPALLPAVRRVDERRYEIVRGLFHEMGFTGDELDVRAHAFVVYHSLHHAFLVSLPANARQRHLRARHALFTRQ